MTATDASPQTDLTAGWRPVQPLLVEREGGNLFASSPLSPHRVRVGVAVVAYLLGGEPLTSASAQMIETLCRVGLIEPVPRQQADFEGDDVRGDGAPDVQAGTPRSSYPTPWNYWGSLAWAFHNRTQDATFLRRGTDSFDAWQRELRADAAPPPTALGRLKHDAPAVLLPRVRKRLDIPLQEVLEDRRTHRSFKSKPVDVDTFGTVMHFSFAPMRFADARELGVLELRSYVSGGARHETTAVVAVLNVAGIEPGLYVYDQVRHGLVPLPAAVSRAELERMTGEQGFLEDCAFSVLTVADTAAMAWKYRHPRAYRHLMNNVGAFAQVFSMTCHATGLGAAITGALDDTGVARLVGLETPREIPTFSLSAGHPVRGAADRPADFISATTPYSAVKGLRSTERPGRS